MEEGKTDSRKESENIRLNVLTGIDPAYTLSATQKDEAGEVDELMVKNFLDTLAEVALAIASRKAER